MPVSTTWSVTGMKRTTADGNVYEVSWRCIAQNDSGPEQAVEAGKLRMEADPSDPNFIPYEQLTEADVLGWVWDEVDKEAIELDRVGKVDAQIERNNSTADGLPWVDEVGED